MADQDKHCVKCGAPRPKGFVGLVTDMCLACARVHLGVEPTDNHSEQVAQVEKPDDPKSEAEEATGAEQAPSMEEGEQPSRGRKVSNTP